MIFPKEIGDYTILGIYWLNSGFSSIGIVVIQKMKNEPAWTARIGNAYMYDENWDINSIAKNGAKLPKHAAIAFFPNLDPDECLNPDQKVKTWKEVKLKE